MIDKTKVFALRQMDKIAKELEELEKVQRDLRLDYWHHQAIAYPTGECQHGSTHFCCHCTGGNNE